MVGPAEQEFSRLLQKRSSPIHFCRKSWCEHIFSDRRDPGCAYCLRPSLRVTVLLRCATAARRSADRRLIQASSCQQSYYRQLGMEGFAGKTGKFIWDLLEQAGPNGGCPRNSAANKAYFSSPLVMVRSHSKTTQPTLASEAAEHLSGVSASVCQYDCLPGRG